MILQLRKELQICTTAIWRAWTTAQSWDRLMELSLKVYSMNCNFSMFSMLYVSSHLMYRMTYEGIAVDVISNITKYFIQNGIFTLQQFNYILKTFDYAECDKSDKPQTVKRVKSWAEFRVKQNAIEMSNPVRLYPVMFGHFVPSENTVWITLLGFVHVVELICAPSFAPGEILFLRDQRGSFGIILGKRS